MVGQVMFHLAAKAGIIGAHEGVIPRTEVIERYRVTDPQRCAR